MSTQAAVPTPGIQIASAKPVREMTREEKIAHWRKLSKTARYADQSTVVGEVHMHYFWADKNDDPELIRLDSLGYTIVREPNVEQVLAGKAKAKLQAAGLKEDGTYVRGDLILMQVPQEDYEFFLLDIEQRHEQGMKGITEEFREQARMAGAPTFEVSRPK
jgi:hypothetical protein